MFRFVVIAAAVAAAAAAPAPKPPATETAAFHATSAPLPPAIRDELATRKIWRPGCPVGLKDLRLLTVTYRGFDHRTHTGRLVVNASATAPLSKVFRRLYALHFPIRDMHFQHAYGPGSNVASNDDVSASFSCRQAVPSPCTGGLTSGHWSMHAFGLAVDINPRENPYVGCGQSHSPTARRYRDRSRHLPGMVTPRAIAAFASIGWGWGGAWAGTTKDYMHFSASGH